MPVKVYMEFYDELRDIWFDKYQIAEFCNKDWAVWFVRRAKKNMGDRARLLIEEEE